MKKIYGLTISLMLCCNFTVVAQQTIHVPADQPTIQAGINAASNGDTVLVAPGTYTENIDFKGKSIVVTSGATDVSGASNTIIQPAKIGPIVTFQTNEPPTAVLNGFTIQGGFSIAYTDPGGDGVDVIGASPTLSNNILTQNAGCGIYAENPTTLIIKNNSIIANLIVKTLSGTGYAHCGPSFNSTVNITGEGIFVLRGGSVQIIGNSIQNNPNAQVSLVIVQHTLIENNLLAGSELFGSGEYMSSSAPPGDVQVVQNVFYANMLADGWGVISVDTSTNEFGNYTWVQNTVYNGLFGFTVFPSAAKIANNVLSFNSGLYTPVFQAQDYQLLVCDKVYGVYDYSQFVANNNDIDDEGIPAARTNCPLSTGNLNADPQFLSTNPASFDFHTQRTSPVVASGDINAPLIPPTDFAGKNRTVCGTIDMGAYEVHPQPPISVVGSPNPSVGGSNVTFTAQLTGNCNVPTGTVTFMDGANPLGTVPLASNASAVFSTAGLTVGSHSITVTYPGDFNFDPSTSPPLIQVVTGYPTATTLSVSPNPANAFTPITFISTVSSAFGTPTGTVAFTANGKLLATATLNANGIATATISTLGAGTYNILATYSADVNFAASSSATVIEVVNGANSVTALQANPNPASVGQNVTFNVSVRATQGSAVPTGTVTLTDGSTPLGTATLDTSGNASFGISTLAVGSHTITATYSGSGNFNVSSASVVEVITTIQSSVTLTASPNPAAVGQSVTMTATVTAAAGTPITGGTVTFYDGTPALTTVPVDTTGHASFSTSTLSIGTHNLTAVYTGTTTFGTSTSAVFQETILPVAFTLSLAPSTITLHGGQQGSTTIQLASVGVFAGPLSLTYGALPMYATGKIMPGTVTLAAGGTGAATFLLNTVVKAESGVPVRPGSRGLPGVFAAVMLLVLPLVRGRKRLARLLGLVMSAVVLQGMMGCTNLSYAVNAVAPGTYMVPITATDGSGNAKSAVLTVVVTP